MRIAPTETEQGGDGGVAAFARYAIAFLEHKRSLEQQRDPPPSGATATTTTAAAATNDDSKNKNKKKPLSSSLPPPKKLLQRAPTRKSIEAKVNTKFVGPAEAARLLEIQRKKQAAEEEARKAAIDTQKKEAKAEKERAATQQYRSDRERDDKEAAAAAAALAALTPEQRQARIIAEDAAFERLRAGTRIRNARRTDKYGQPYYRAWIPIRRDPVTGARLPEEDGRSNYAGEDRAVVFVTDGQGIEAPLYLTFEDLKKRYGGSDGRLREMPIAIKFGSDFVFYEFSKSIEAREARGEIITHRDGGDEEDDHDDVEAVEGALGHDNNNDDQNNKKRKRKGGAYALPKRKGRFALRWPLHGADYEGYCAYMAELNEPCHGRIGSAVAHDV
jgi:hypothetical protein